MVLVSSSFRFLFHPITIPLSERDTKERNPMEEDVGIDRTILSAWEDVQDMDACMKRWETNTSIVTRMSFLFHKNTVSNVSIRISIQLSLFLGMEGGSTDTETILPAVPDAAFRCITMPVQ